MGGRSIFTIRGHYIVLVGYNETEKKFLINDPGPRDVREASVNEFKDHVKSMWVIEGISR
ncbi:MAG: hypothetical protein KatS3mg095_0353 [Candidatus Parcubacteria bacterium]|nr:MAG: hypothetical protein KatS3mg095_0353 [Candidatus Parcubacteria bacterium]